jgi:DNA polymerase elongation subunit (family B)
MKSGARVLLLDIETFPIIAAVWNLFEANAVWVESDTFLACFSAQWYGEKTKTYALPDYHGFRKYTDKDDKPLLADLFSLLSEAQVVVAHNGDAFDIKKINARLKIHGFSPPSPFKTYDTLKEARKTFKFDSNKLDNLGRALGVGRKIPNTGAALWRGCRDGDSKSWAQMVRYCKQDVDLLSRVYTELKPWSRSHPNLTMFGEQSGCPVCESVKVQRRGWNIAKTRKTPRFQCGECGHWFSGKRAA